MSNGDIPTYEQGAQGFLNGIHEGIRRAKELEPEEPLVPQQNNAQDVSNRIQQMQQKLNKITKQNKINYLQGQAWVQTLRDFANEVEEKHDVNVNEEMIQKTFEQNLKQEKQKLENNS